jgi:hypothetical protein
VIEAIIILVLLIGGCLFVMRLGIGGWAVPALGYVVGTCLLINFGFIQIISRLPADPLLTLTLTVAAPLHWWLFGREPRHFSYSGIHVVATLFAVMGLVYIFRNANLVGWSNDSLRYLMTGALIASDNFDSVDPKLLALRLLGFPILHAPANLAGEFYLRSAGPLLGISGIGLFVWLGLKGLSPCCRAGPVFFTALGVLLLVTNSRMLWSAFALFPHLLSAVLILLIAGSGWLIATASKRAGIDEIEPAALLALQSIAIPALVIARAEGGLMVAIAILPTLLCQGVALKYRASLLCIFGASLAAWNLLLLSSLTANDQVRFSILGPLALGVLSLAAASLLFLRKVRERVTVLEERRSLILVTTEVALWIVLAAAAVWKPEILVKSISATGHNLLYGAGGWGYSLIILALLILVCAVAARASELAFLRFPVTSFVPLCFLLAYMREGAYRIGPGDALNRMWIHIVPLAVLLVVAAVSSDQWRGCFLKKSQKPSA